MRTVSTDELAGAQNMKNLVIARLARVFRDVNDVEILYKATDAVLSIDYEKELQRVLSMEDPSDEP